MEQEVIILGGGLTGPSLSYFLDKKSLILEKNEIIGGLCKTFKKGKFFYDIGGHIIFSKDQEILKFMVGILGENIQKLFRKNKVFFNKKYVKYPFENGLNEINIEDRFKCLYNFIQNDSPSPANFKEWIYHRFGKGIGELYLEPYNKKIWKYPLEKMDLGWVERVPRPPMADIVKAALGIETEGYVHQLYFYYPKIGGIQSLPEAILDGAGEKTELVTNYDIGSVKKVDGKWEVYGNGGTYLTDTLISTIPIFDLVELLSDVPERVKDAIKGLVYNRMYVVLIGVDNPDLNDKTAVYVPDEEIIFHRIVFNKYFGDQYVPESKSAITAEITFPPESELEGLDNEEVVNKVVEGLSKMGIIKEEDVIETDIKEIEHAYVVYDEEYEKNIKIIREFFDEIGIHLCGRFAEFQYLNMDACIKNAKELAGKLNGNE